jgi:hypothetical protein
VTADIPQNGVCGNFDLPSNSNLQTLFGFEFSNSEYVNSMVQRLRYEEWAGNRMTNTGIRFEYDGGTVTIAKQADRPTPGI